LRDRFTRSVCGCHQSARSGLGNEYFARLPRSERALLTCASRVAGAGLEIPRETEGAILEVADRWPGARPRREPHGGIGRRHDVHELILLLVVERVKMEQQAAVLRLVLV